MKENKNNIFAIIIFIIILIFLGVFLYARYIGTNGLIIKEYKIESENLPASFNGIKLVHLSDFHLGRTTTIEDLEEMINQVNILKPDLIIFTGDLISSYKNVTEEEKSKIIEILSNLEFTIGKYAIKGNIDYNETFDNIMSNSNFIVLENNFELIYSNGLTPIFLGGISSPIKKDINLETVFSYFSSIEEELYKANYKIILTHEGDVIEDIIKYDSTVDLILGGHSLNGSVIIPYYGQLFLPDGSRNYYAPYYKVNQTQIFISSGIGTDKHKFRLFNKPSFNFYRFKSL